LHFCIKTNAFNFIGAFVVSVVLRQNLKGEQIELADDVSILDFGSGKITVLIGKRGLNDTIVLSGKAEVEYGGFVNGEFLEPNKLPHAIAAAISSAEQSARQTITHLTVGVPGEFTVSVCQDASLSLGRTRKIVDEDIDELHEQANSFKTNKDYTLINDQPIYYTLDDGRRLIQPVGLESSKLGGHISYVLAENHFIDLIDAILKQLDIKSHDYISSLVATSMYLFEDSMRDRYIVFLDSGRITTNAVVARGDGILSQYNIPYGGGHITGALAMDFKISYAEAESLKQKIALNLNVSDKDVYTITTNRSDTKEFNAKRANLVVSGVIKLIAETITKALKNCTYDYPDYIPYHLTGGGITYIKGAGDLLSKCLKKPVEIAVPKLPLSNKPHLSSSLGLLDMALRLVPEPVSKPKSFFKKIFGSRKKSDKK